MSEYRSTCTIAVLAARVRAATHIAVVSHAKPDGDAAGSVLAVARALRHIGKRVDAVLTPPVDGNILSLAAPGEVIIADRWQPAATIDLAVLVDTGSWGQVEPLDGWLRTMAGRVIGLDHHGRGDEIAGDRVVDTSMASATQLATKLIDELAVPLVAQPGSARHSIAEAIFAGLATDTGWFRFQSAGSEVFTLGARLLAVGVDKESLYQRLEENGRPARLGAMARALASLSFHCNSGATIMSITGDDFVHSGASTEDVGGIVNIPLAIGSVCLSVVLTEAKPGTTKASFRSKPAPDGSPCVNVSDLAARWGGGGHALAAGAKFPCGIGEARAIVTRAVESLSLPMLPVQ